MSFDANAYRDASLANWEEAAPGWVRREALLREFAAPVSHWMIDAIAPQPGQRVLELAAGIGETALLAAELVAPLGGVVISDQAEGMLAGARARAVALGLSNVEFQVLNAEWIDLPVASVDAALCRWGYMLMADPAVALSETRRVLRSGGRVALAVWDALERNPWALLPARELIERSLAAPPDPELEPAPGPFRLASAERLRELLRARRLRRDHRRGARSEPPPRGLRGPLGLDARPVAQLPRRGALAPGRRGAGDQALTRRALRPIRGRGRDARDPRAHAARLGQRVSGCAGAPRAEPRAPFG